VRRVTIHARKAWLKGLSPKENREVPPLDYGLVADMKRDFPELWIGINGGITTLDEATGFLKAGLDGVMIGRAAYHAPNTVLLEADRQIFNSDRVVSPETVIYAMLPYIEEHLTAGGRLHQITRHMLGLFSGQPGARLWRRRLSDAAALRTSGPELIEAALNEIAPLRAA
jgi:tRNA-dihydrouridine synthase A